MRKVSKAKQRVTETIPKAHIKSLPVSVPNSQSGKPQYTGHWVLYSYWLCLNSGEINCILKTALSQPKKP